LGRRRCKRRRCRKRMRGGLQEEVDMCVLNDEEVDVNAPECGGEFAGDMYMYQFGGCFGGFTRKGKIKNLEI